MENKTAKPEADEQKPEPESPVSARPPVRIGAVRFSVRLFLIFLGLFFVTSPFVEKLPNGRFLDGSLLTAVLLSGVFAVGGTRRKLTAALVLAVPAIIARWTQHFQPELPKAIFLVPGLVFFVFLIANLLHFIARARRVDADVLCAGISVYLLLGLAWMLAYLLVAEFSPDAFAFTAGPDSVHTMTPFTAYYFSLITMTTVGYGDIVPVSDVARMLASVEAMTGTLFMAVLIARLVSLYSTQTPEDPGTKLK